MEKSLNLNIADIHLRLIIGEFDDQIRWLENFRGFIGDGIPDLVLTTHYGRLPDVSSGAMVFDSGGIWRLYRRPEGWALWIEGAQDQPPLYQIVLLNEDFSAGEIYLPLDASGKRHPPFWDALTEILMVLLLAKGRGVLVHACAVQDGETCYLCPGVSGEGKSTMARLWSERKEARVLSDERVIVRKKEGRFWVYGTPWLGEARLVSPEPAGVDQVFFLRHAQENRAVRLKPSEAAARFLVRSFPTFWDQEGMQFTLDFLAELSQAVPCYELSFLPSQEVVAYKRGLR